MVKKKCVADLRVAANERLNERHVLLRLDIGGLPVEASPGQFVEVRIDDAPGVMLRRPISICDVDRERGEMWLLVACVGEGTRRLARLNVGDRLNCMLPLGRGWSSGAGGSWLLVGGGVGVAPLLYQGRVLSGMGCRVTFLIGARTASDLLLTAELARHGRVLVTTEDGSAGERGFVTHHTVLRSERFDMVQCCGPTPMMKAVVAHARATDTPCEVSLENMMACGLGACLCCVEKTVGGHVCVCTEGPVFRKEELLWQD